MDITRNGTSGSTIAPGEFFTGHAIREPLFSVKSETPLVGGAVTFSPGARTVWHTHPLGQILIITHGVGRVGTWGGPVQEVRSGDVVSFEPGEKHWHGAGVTTAMSHIAIVQRAESVGTDWLEPVSDAQYSG